ncbi:MAG: hypothetical protein IMW99_06180 [Firmicutes bacterium]|nr:hypothetical protein [Bacillota bacterium]
MTETKRASWNSDDGKDIRAVSEELPKILDTVVEKVPALIRGLVEAAFSESTGRELGKSVAAFYATLKQQGLPDDMVNQMTRDYLQAQSALLVNASKSFSTGRGPGSEDEE